MRGGGSAQKYSSRDVYAELHYVSFICNKIQNYQNYDQAKRASPDWQTMAAHIERTGIVIKISFSAPSHGISIRQQHELTNRNQAAVYSKADRNLY